LVTYYLSGALNLQNLIKNLASLAKNKTGEFLSWVKWKFIIFRNREFTAYSKRIAKKILEIKTLGMALMGIGHPVIGELGGMGGVIKKS
jgi:hypothetical protein